MIRIRINYCNIFKKQRQFLHGLDNLQKLVSVGAICRFIFSFFANQNFSRDRKAVLLRKWIALILQVKFRFMGCLVKTNALVPGNIASSLSLQLIVLFLRNSHLQRDTQKTFSRQCFCELLENSCSASKKRFSESFRKFTKKHLWRSLILSKVAGFYRSSQRRCSQKGVCKIHLKTPVSETLIFIKMQA